MQHDEPVVPESVLADHLGPLHAGVRAVRDAYRDAASRVTVLRAFRAIAENPGRLYPGSESEWAAVGRALASLDAARASHALAELNRHLFTLDVRYWAQRRRFRALAGALDTADAAGAAALLGDVSAAQVLADRLSATLLADLLRTSTVPGVEGALALVASYQPRTRLPPRAAREIRAIAEVVALADRTGERDAAARLVEAFNQDTDPPPLRRAAMLPRVARLVAEAATRAPQALGAILDTVAALAAVPLALDAPTVARLDATVRTLALPGLEPYLLQARRLVTEFQLDAVPFAIADLPGKLEALVVASNALPSGDAPSPWLDALVTAAAWSEESGTLVLACLPGWVSRVPADHHAVLARTLAHLGPILPALGQETLDRAVEVAHALAPHGQCEPFLRHLGELGETHAEVVATFIALAAAAAELGKPDSLESLVNAFHRERILRTPWARKLPRALARLSALAEPWGSEHWSAALAPCLSAAASSPESALALANGLETRLPTMAIETRLTYLRSVHALVDRYGVRFVGYALTTLADAAAPSRAAAG